MTKLIVILLLALVVEAVGVVLLSKGLKQVGEVSLTTLGGTAQAVRRGMTNPNILVGVLLEAIFFAALLYLLAHADVSVVWPLTSLGFVLTALAAKFLLHESVSGVRWAGVILIVIGAGLITWSEKAKSNVNLRSEATPTAPAMSPAPPRGQ
jgi:drug/metabolite transporter (DMT)-like permease